MSAPNGNGNGEKALLRAIAAWALVALQGLVLYEVRTSLARLERLEEWRALHTVESIQLGAANDRDKADLRRDIAAALEAQERTTRVMSAIARRVGVRLDQVQ